MKETSQIIYQNAQQICIGVLAEKFHISKCHENVAHDCEIFIGNNTVTYVFVPLSF